MAQRSNNAPEPVVLSLDQGGILPSGAENSLVFLLLRDQGRTLRIRVARDGTVTVKAPCRVRQADIVRAVKNRWDWVEARREHFRQYPPPPVRRWTEGESFPYLGRFFLLHLEEDPRAPARRLPVASLHGRKLVVRGATLTPRRVQRAVEIWQRHTGEKLYAKRLARLHAHACRILGDVPLPALRVRALKRRWGSCRVYRGAGEITLAQRLSAAPLPCVDQVILHELCHLWRMDHSAAFHALLRRLSPDAAAHERRLRQWALEHDEE